MEKLKVLFVNQEMLPFLPESNMSTVCRRLPQGIQESGKEIRVFLPRFGVINERRHQLHEVIRLSGMNIIIDDTDHPLIIKVASIQAARMQVYFIDNDDYFKRKSAFGIEEGKFFEDNDERAIFYARGVLETVKKLGWVPDVIHCHGWFSALMPLYLKKFYHDDPHFTDTKVVTSIYNDHFEGELSKKLLKKLQYDNFAAEDINVLKKPDYINLMKAAINHSDAVIIAEDELDEKLAMHIEETNKPFMPKPSDGSFVADYSMLYERVASESTMLIDEE